jgi:hypothetical protein
MLGGLLLHRYVRLQPSQGLREMCLFSGSKNKHQEAGAKSSRQHLGLLAQRGRIGHGPVAAAQQPEPEAQARPGRRLLHDAAHLLADRLQLGLRSTVKAEWDEALVSWQKSKIDRRSTCAAHAAGVGADMQSSTTPQVPDLQPVVPHGPHKHACVAAPQDALVQPLQSAEVSPDSPRFCSALHSLSAIAGRAKQARTAVIGSAAAARTESGMKLPWASQERGHSSMRSTAPGTWGPGTGLAMWLRLRLPSRSPRPRFRLALLSAAWADAMHVVQWTLNLHLDNRTAVLTTQSAAILTTEWRRISCKVVCSPSPYVHMQAV